MYISSMGGEHWMTVDEDTRRRLFDIGEDMLIDGNKVLVDFDALSVDTLEFKVRNGSLIQRKEDEELSKLTAMMQPIVQNLNGWSEENRNVIENEVLLPITRRMIELTGTDISSTLSDSLTERILDIALAPVKDQQMQQQMQLDAMQAQMQEQQALMQPVPGDEEMPLPVVPEAGQVPSPAPVPEQATTEEQAEAKAMSHALDILAI